MKSEDLFLSDNNLTETLEISEFMDLLGIPSGKVARVLLIGARLSSLGEYLVQQTGLDLQYISNLPEFWQEHDNNPPDAIVYRAQTNLSPIEAKLIQAILPRPTQPVLGYMRILVIAPGRTKRQWLTHMNQIVNQPSCNISDITITFVDTWKPPYAIADTLDQELSRWGEVFQYSRERGLQHLDYSELIHIRGPAIPPVFGFETPQTVHLSYAQLEILKGFIEQQAADEVALKLGISVDATEKYLSTLLNQVGLLGQKELIQAYSTGRLQLTSIGAVIDHKYPWPERPSYNPNANKYKYLGRSRGQGFGKKSNKR